MRVNFEEYAIDHTEGKHHFVVYGHNCNIVTTLHFQNDQEPGLNGLTDKALIRILIWKLEEELAVIEDEEKRKRLHYLKLSLE